MKFKWGWGGRVTLMAGRELLRMIIYNRIIVIICGNFVSLNPQNLHLRIVVVAACCPGRTG